MLKKIVTLAVTVAMVAGCGRAYLKTDYGEYQVDPYVKETFDAQQDVYRQYAKAYSAAASTPIVRIPQGDGKAPIEVYRQMPLPAVPEIRRIPSANEVAVVEVARFIKDLSIGLAGPVVSWAMARENRKSSEALWNAWGNVAGGLRSDGAGPSTVISGSYNSEESHSDSSSHTATDTSYGDQSGNQGDVAIRQDSPDSAVSGSYNTESAETSTYTEANETITTTETAETYTYTEAPVVPIVPHVVPPVVLP